jgi:predicted transcriptional regulator
MPRKPSSQLNDVELAILRVLWDRGPSTIRDVHDALAATRDAGYTSTAKMMQVMCDKGLLVRTGAQPPLYRPAASAAVTQRQILKRLIDQVFGGNTRKLVMRAVETGKVTSEERAAIQAFLKKYKGEEK